jgi:hypothetical protein
MYSSPAPRELIVVTDPEIGLRVTAEGLRSKSDRSLRSLGAMLSMARARLEPVFGLSEDLLEYRISNLNSEKLPRPTYWSRFYKLSAPDEVLETLAELLRDHWAIQSVFIKPGAELPLHSTYEGLVPAEPDEATTDYSGLQIYLGPSPHGINAREAWKKPGGKGEGINIIDVEGAWRFTHEDLKENCGGLIGGVQNPALFWRDHGSAVMGMLGGDLNAGGNFGVIGICPDANLAAVSIFGQPTSHLAGDSGTAAAIRQAADKLNKGDIMLLELQLPGPARKFQVAADAQDQVAYVPVEWWPDNLLAIQYAVTKGIIVVEAAGNGASNLDDPILNANPPAPQGPFPADWKNPLERKDVDSGAILVGAGAPPNSNTVTTPDRGRLDSSNFGHQIDAQGWGRDVVTCGVGDLQGIDEDRWYQSDFGGTSAAAPMVAGALASVQGILDKAGKKRLTPARARELLRQTGSPQTGNAASERIGNRPDILTMLTELGL